MNKQQPPDSGNLIAAMLLCLAVLVGWQYFFVAPQIEKERAARAAQQQQQTQTTPGATTPGAPAAPGAAATPTALPPGQLVPVDTALATGGERLTFDNAKVDGSIRLTGATIDNLRLKDYRETVDPKSAEIVFL